MSFDWSNYLELARGLAGFDNASPTEESRFRSAISRAYYAAFCTARNFLIERNEMVPGEPDTHKKVPDAFRRAHGDKTKQGIAARLDQLKQYRRKADYEDVYTGLNGEVRTVIQITHHVLNAIREIS